MQLTGGQALAKMLELHGVEYMFGMGGFQLLPMYRAMAETTRLKHILIHDERAGAFMADGYARITGRAIACDGTLGPGATNLITGLAESYGASIPVIAVTGDVNSAIASRGATQESDQVSMIRPAVKKTIHVGRTERIPELVRWAFNVATRGRPGPVHLNVAEDAVHGSATFAEADFLPHGAGNEFPRNRIRPDSASVERAAALLAKAERPVILAGGGVHISQAWAPLLELVEKYQIPVATSISGKGAISEVHPLSIGVAGRFSRFANDMIAEADLIFVVGCKLGEIVTSRWTIIPPNVPIIQLDIDPDIIGRNYPVEVALWADAREGIKDLLEALASLPTSAVKNRDAVADRIAELRNRWQQAHEHRLNSDQIPIDQSRLMHELNKNLPANTVVVADGGFAAHWSALFYDVKQQGRWYIANRGQASIGYGVPGAIGVRAGAPEDSHVIALCGDAGFSMSMAELETALRLNQSLIVLVVNNSASGYVKALQYQYYGGHFQSVDYRETDFAALARGLGAAGERITRPDQIGPAIQRALERGSVTVLDVQVTRNPEQMLPGRDPRLGKK